MPEIIVILHNIRSTYNVGSILRTSEGMGIKEVIISGYSPYPIINNDPRLPHLANKIDNQIHKTALGAEKLLSINYQEQLDLQSIKDLGYTIVALEQSADSIILNQYLPPQKIALLLGEEVSGIESALLSEADQIIEIPMRGKKESYNVAVATGIALYHLTNS